MREKKNSTCFRIEKEGTNARIMDCTYVTSIDSNRTFVETNAENTHVIRAKIIELPRAIVEQVKSHKLFWFFVVPLGITIIGGIIVEWVA